MKCLSTEQIRQYVAGGRTDAVEAHLSDCQRCRSMLVAEVSTDDESLVVSDIQQRRTVDAMLTASAAAAQRPARSVATWYRLAACLIGAAALGTVAVVALGLRDRTVVSRESTPVESAVNATRTVPQSGQREATEIRVSSPPVALPPVTVRDVTVPATLSVRTTRVQREVLRLGTTAAVLIDSDVRITIEAGTPRTATCTLRQGRAFFSITPHAYDRFVVSTPSAVVEVTGTVFSVMVSPHSTSVQTFEGCVQVRHMREAHLVVQASAGHAVLAERDTLIEVLPSLDNALLDAVRLLMRHSPARTASVAETPAAPEDSLVGRMCRALGVEIVLDPVHASTMVDSFVVIHPEASCREVLRLGLAKALEGRGEFALALRYYEAYLKTAPSGPDRSAAVDRSAACVARAGLTESEGRFCTTQVSGSVIVKRP